MDDILRKDKLVAARKKVSDMQSLNANVCSSFWANVQFQHRSKHTSYNVLGKCFEEVKTGQNFWKATKRILSIRKSQPSSLKFSTTFVLHLQMKKGRAEMTGFSLNRRATNNTGFQQQTWPIKNKINFKILQTCFSCLRSSLQHWCENNGHSETVEM